MIEHSLDLAKESVPMVWSESVPDGQFSGSTRLKMLQGISCSGVYESKDSLLSAP